MTASSGENKTADLVILTDEVVSLPGDLVARLR